MKTRLQSVFLILIFLTAQNVFAGRVVVSNDEWPLSNTGITRAPDAHTFATNVASWFTGGEPGSFLVYSTNFGLTGSLLSGTMVEAGHAWEVNYQAPFSLDNLLQYDGIFLAGDPADTSILTEYVASGGNVYLAGGTAVGDAVSEANRWNPFLSTLGLGFQPFYSSNPNGNITIMSEHPIFKGVSALYQLGGSQISLLEPNDSTEFLVTFNGKGLFAAHAARVFDTKYIPTVPLPTSVWLLGSGLIGLIGIGRRNSCHRKSTP